MILIRALFALLWLAYAGLMIPVVFRLARQVWRSSMEGEWVDLWAAIMVTMITVCLVVLVLVAPWLIATGTWDPVPDTWY